MLVAIERFLREKRMSPTRFGREAVGDPNLVAQLKCGRQLRAGTARRVTAYLNRNEEPQPCDCCRS